MEEKKFLEVFPYLKLEGRLKDEMEQVSVTRVASVKSQNLLRVYIRSCFLISKRDIFQVEDILNGMLRSYRDSWQIKIYERFDLSSQYDARTVMELYRDSILEELKAYSHVLYILFKNAKITYPSKGHIHVEMEDNCIVHMQEKELRAILDKVFLERCGLAVSFTYSYKEIKREEDAEEDFSINKRIEEISQRRMAAGAESTASGGRLAGNSSAGAASGGRAAQNGAGSGKASTRNGGSEQSSSYKEKSANTARNSFSSGRTAAGNGETSGG
ncbi:MAG: hypothetical protein LUH58_01340, partial [Lachnospiraceae bacterium]|nr:hypothetical protein [Lachnospiraceae bacterium]